MLSKFSFSFGALALAALATAKPIPAFKEVLAKRGHSFNNYGGYDHMSNFDDFYGADDYSGVKQKVVHEKEVVCHTEKVEIVQQHLAVIREWYKKIITEQVCEVEIQTVVHHQFVSGCEYWGDDLRRKSDRKVYYDHDVASKIVELHDEHNECVVKDYGYHGYDIGSHAISYSGDNWKKDYSKPIVDKVYSAAVQSYGYCSPSYSPYWQSGYSSPSYSEYHGPSYDSTYYEHPSYDSSYKYDAPSSEYSHYEYSAPEHYKYEAPSYYTYEAPSYTYEAPSYGESHTIEAPSYGYGGSEYHTYEAPSYGYGHEYNTYEAAPPTYTAAPYYGGSYHPSSSVESACAESCASGSQGLPPSLAPADGNSTGTPPIPPPVDGGNSTTPSTDGTPPSATDGAAPAPAGTDSAAAAAGTDSAAAAATPAASPAAAPPAASSA